MGDRALENSSLLQDGGGGDMSTETSDATATNLLAVDLGQPSPADSVGDVVAVFVARFDVHKGNMISWVYPKAFTESLEGCEWKALCSGFHRVDEDYVIFKQGGFFGQACFRKQALEGEAAKEERGSRMVSVGVLTGSYQVLRGLRSFLAEQAEAVCSGADTLALRAWFDEQRTAALRHTGKLPRLRHVANEVDQLTSFSQFVEFYGPAVFLLWKAALLERRILFYTPVPVGVVCERVLNATQMLSHSGTSVLLKDPHPLFYVSVADITALQSMQTFVACTTERIFVEKPQLYDVLVDNHEVRVGASLAKTITLTNADRKRYEVLRSWIHRERDASHAMSDAGEHTLVRFFEDLNNSLLSSLLAVSRGSKVVAAGEMDTLLGLHPWDAPFVRLLCQLYGIDVQVADYPPCCCCLGYLV